MLYQFYEWQRQMLAPMEGIASQTASLLRHPLNPFYLAPGAQAMAAVFERYANTQANYQVPSFEFSGVMINGEQAKVSEEIAVSSEFCINRRFCAGSPTQEANAIGMISPLSGNHAVVFNEAVNCFLPTSSVWVTDWQDARNIPPQVGRFGLDENVSHIIAFIRQAKPNLVMCFSQSSNPTLIALSMLAREGFPCIPSHVVILGGPIDTRINSGALGYTVNPADREWVEQNLIMAVPSGYRGAGRKVFPGFLQHAGFMGLHWDRQLKNQWEQVLTAAMGNASRSSHVNKNASLLNAVMDLPAEHYLDNLDHFFLNHTLAKGELFCLGEKVDLSILGQSGNLSVMVVEGERDNLCPPGQTQAVFGLLPHLTQSRQAYLQVKDCGHFGLVGGHHFHQSIFPAIQSWRESPQSH